MDNLDMRRSLVLPPTKVRASEILKSQVPVSRWHKDEFDMRESLILPLAKVRPGEMLELILQYLADM
jgi:hypothetical protein